MVLSAPLSLEALALPLIFFLEQRVLEEPAQAGD